MPKIVIKGFSYYIEAEIKNNVSNGYQFHPTNFMSFLNIDRRLPIVNS